VGSAAADAVGDEGQTLATHGSFTDGDGNGTLTITSSDGLVVDNHDGTWSWSLPTTDDGTGSVSVFANDGEHTAAFDSFTWTATNVAPSIAISGAASVNEGSSYSLTLGAITDPGSDTVTGWLVHWGDGSSDSYGSGGVKTHTYADGPNDRTITVDLTDEDGTFTDAANAQAVHVDNVAPATSGLTGDAIANESSSTIHTYAYTLFDPGLDTVTAHPSCGTGGVLGTNSNTNTGGTFNCTFPDGPASPTVSVYATDDDAPGNGNPGNTQSIPVTVSNVKPTPSITSLSGTGVTACSAGNTATLTFSWTDPAGTNDTYSYDVNWGDGNHTTAALGATSPVTLSHLYVAGTYSITVTVNDSDPGSGSAVSSSSFSNLYGNGGILQPINATGTRSSFKIGSTIPVKVKVFDCNGVAVSGLTILVHLVKLDNSADPANETIPDSVPDAGTQMRFTGTPDNQYIYNLSTKRSQLCSSLAPCTSGGDLTAGTYLITLTNAYITNVTASIDLKN
jgi:hypothetical protein